MPFAEWEIKSLQKQAKRSICRQRAALLDTSQAQRYF
jgi:hypothetical protein